MSETINLSDLSPEQREELLKQAEEQKKAEKLQKEQDRETYKRLKSEQVPDLIKAMQEAERYLAEVKAKVYESVQDIVDLKLKLYPARATNASHTFSDEENENSITIGYRVNTGYDDTVHEGVAMVFQAVRDNANIDPIVDDLLSSSFKQDLKGNYNPKRILEAKNKLSKYDIAAIQEGFDIIDKAYNPRKSSYYVEGMTRDNLGREQNVKLSIASVNFPEGYEQLGDKVFNVEVEKEA